MLVEASCWGTPWAHYYMMLSSCAVQYLTECSRHLFQVGSVEVSNGDMIHSKHQKNDDDVRVLLSGQYEIYVLQAVINEMQTEHTMMITWLMENTDKNNNLKYKLSKDLVWCLHWKKIHSEEAITKIIGYTRAIVTSNSSNKRSIFYSHPCYQGEEWYNWVIVHFEETNPFGENIETFYPSWLLGFITSNGTREAMIQCYLLLKLKLEKTLILLLFLGPLNWYFIHCVLFLMMLITWKDILLFYQSKIEVVFLGTISIDKCNTYVLFTCEQFPNWWVFATIGGITPWWKKTIATAYMTECGVHTTQLM